MRGPFPIVGRGHSGGRLLCEAFIRAGVEMGRVNPRRKDTRFFSVRNPEALALYCAGFGYSQASSAERETLERRFRTLVECFVREEIPPGRPYGWKIGASLFALPILLDAFPEARVVHLVRDGRDVMLSRLDARIAHLAESEFDRLAVFGNAGVTSFRGLPLGDETIAAHRNELEMLHWVTAVSFAREAARAAPERVLEVRYEDLCVAPREQLSRIFAFLDRPLPEPALDWIAAAARTDRIGKWRSAPPPEIEAALELGRPLLAELGYG